MTPQQLENWIEENYDGLKVIDTYGEQSFFYNPNNLLPKGVYFATIKTNDGPNDKASNLNRNNVYRFSFGIGKSNYVNLFGNVPKRPLKGKIVNLNLNFEELNTLMPHPIYSWISWVNILSPKADTIMNIKYLIDFAYEKATKSYYKKIKP